MDFFNDSKSFKKSRNHQFGMLEGFYVDYTKQSGYYVFTIYTDKLEDDIGDHIENYKYESGEWFRDIYLGHDGNNLILKIKASNTHDRVNDILKFIYDFIIRLELKNTAHCSYCGTESTECFFDPITKKIVNICEKCYHSPELKEKQQGMIKEQGAGAGILGAVIGALIGSLPYIVAAYFFNIYMGYIAFVIGAGASIGYMAAKGPRKIGLASVSVVLPTLFFAAVSNLVVYNIQYFNLILENLDYNRIFYKNIFQVFDIVPADAAMNVFFSNDKYAVFDKLTFSTIVREAWIDFAIAIVISIIGVLIMQFTLKDYTAEKENIKFIPLSGSNPYADKPVTESDSIQETEQTENPPVTDVETEQDGKMEDTEEIIAEESIIVNEPDISGITEPERDGEDA